ncbi:MAG: murein biosynthesis integral membrane protein MurJ [Gammaproteobacteria bacterium]|jgi:putative peptidoglycan lipid II flippase|nr:murein biosynthesis integral membrane protein MurJ [Gammaproteobacteria bacterium]MBQ0774800.1 murein biosynthesis integral membrane protein MurJ [Gammaproteobacteria bacterium]|tara:strand:- start:23386 stop:25023 length:1638 start_codon:yes stop_codon:yes gene_type:complete
MSQQNDKSEQDSVGAREEAEVAAPAAAPKRQGGLVASTAVVSVMTLLSRVLGLARDVVLARLLGASAGTDAFFVAFRIPNFLRRLFAEGAFNQAFIPVLSEYKNNGVAGAVQALINRVAGTLGVALLLVTMVGVVGAPVLITLFAPGFGDDPAKRALAVEMLRLTFPYLFFIALTAFSGAILNTWNRFAVPAFTPVLLNICLIGAALLLAPMFAEGRMAVALAWGVLAAGVVQLTFQLPFLAQLGLLPKPTMAWQDPGVRRILALMAPAIFGVSVSQINLLLDTVLASLLETGSVTWLYYSDRLVELPLGIFAIAIGTVILPSLSKKHAAATPEAFSQTLDWALRLVLLVGVPAAVALAVIASPLLSTLFQYGEFSGNDVLRASQSLMAYSVGLVAFMLIKVLAPGYFARQDTRTPVRIGIIAMVANMAFNLMLVWHFYHAGLALATSLSAWLNAVLLYQGLRKAGVYRPAPGWPLLLARLLVSASAMAGLLWWLQRYLGSVGIGMDAGAALERAGWLAVLVASGAGCYFICLLLLGLRPRHLRR